MVVGSVGMRGVLRERGAEVKRRNVRSHGGKWETLVDTARDSRRNELAYLPVPMVSRRKLTEL